MTLLVTCVAGALAGVHAATWGAHKDLPFEGFRGRSCLRSIVLASGCALGVGAFFGPPDRPGAMLLLGAVYTTERLATEWWKAILREDDQAGYTIPMRLAVLGRPVHAKGSRYAAGVGVLGVLLTLAWLLAHSGAGVRGLPWHAGVVVLGGVGGWATAVGGAWKDAPVEGFSGWKFLRSPAVATAWAFPMALLSSDVLLLSLAAAGYAVATIETYKTFLTRGRPPGKFAGRPPVHVRPQLRRLLAGVHVTLWCALGAAAATSLLAAQRRGPVVSRGNAHLAGHELGLEAVLIAALTLAASVFASGALRMHRPVRVLTEPSLVQATS